MADLFRLISFVLRLSRDIPHSRLIMFSIAAAGVVSGVANTGMIALINSILTGVPNPITNNQMAVAFVGLCIVLPTFRLISQSLLIQLTQKSLMQMRLVLAERILAAPLRHLEKLGPHRLLAACTTDLARIVESLTMLPLLFIHFSIVLSCLAYLGWLSWKILLQVLVCIVLGIVSYQLPVIRSLRYFTHARRLIDALTKHIRSLTEGTKELKMHRSRRGAFLNDLRRTITELQGHTRAGGLLFAVASSWGQILFFVVVGLLVIVLPRFQPVDQAVLLGYTLVLFHLMTPLEVILNQLPALGGSAVAATNVEKLGLSLKEARIEPDGEPQAPTPDWERLEMVGVTHAYAGENEGEVFTLGPIDLSFRPGELVFLIGGNGSGKTTLAKILLGLYVPEAGELRFRGEPVTDAGRDVYREHFSAVFSDFFLFEQMLGRDHTVLDDDARRYLTELQLDNKVEVKDGVLSTLELSQGQRKRLALLTAYLEDRPIYLFDEWAADQDPKFKETFYLELLPNLKKRGKTVIVISHDDHYYHVADRVIKLDYGQVEYDRTINDYLAHFVDADVRPGRTAAGQDTAQEM